MWKKVAFIDQPKDIVSQTFRTRLEGKALVIEQEVPDEVDITKKCSIEWTCSDYYPDGRFVKISYNGSLIGSFGLDGICHLNADYRFEKCSPASYAVKIFKVNR